MEPKILCPQVIHNHLDCTILRTAKNPVIRLDIEQTSGTVNLLRVYETRIVSVTVNALANRLSLRGLSHFHFLSFLCLYIMHFLCQSPKIIFVIVSLVFSRVYDFLSLRRDSWHCSILPHTVAFCTAFCYTTMGGASSGLH
jgi:hypothetical protein